MLNRGAFPVDVEVRRVETVLPTLGQDSMRAAVFAGLVGVAAVLALLAVFYRRLMLLVFLGLLRLGPSSTSISAIISQTSNFAHAREVTGIDAGLAFGRKLLEHKTDLSPRATGSPPRCSRPGGSLQPLRRHSRRPASRQLHRVRRREGQPAGINLLDYGCIRIFPPSFVGGVVDLYRGLRKGDDDLVVHAYETWGFKRLNRELIDMLNIWARFIYGPLLDDRVRSHRRRREAVRIRPRGGVPRASGAQGQGPGDGAARIRVHGPGRHRAWRRVLHLRRGTQFSPLVQPGDRGFFAWRSRTRRRPARLRSTQFRDAESFRPGVTPKARSHARGGATDEAGVALCGQLR